MDANATGRIQLKFQPNPKDTPPKHNKISTWVGVNGILCIPGSAGNREKPQLQRERGSQELDQEFLAKEALLPSHPGALGVGQVVLTPSRQGCVCARTHAKFPKFCLLVANYPPSP